MKMHLVLAGLCGAGLSISAINSAKAQVPSAASIQTVDGPAACEDFQKNPDGSWTPLVDLQVANGGTPINIPAKTTSFKAGTQNPAKVDVGAMLDDQCRS